MYDVYTAHALHQHQVADITREAELMRRIAERTAATTPSRTSAPVTSRLLTRLQSLVAHLPHHGAPVVGR